MFLRYLNVHPIRTPYKIYSYIITITYKNIYAITITGNTVEPRLSEPPLYEPSIIRTIISVSERSVIRT